MSAYSAIVCVVCMVFLGRDGDVMRAFGWAGVPQPDGTYVVSVQPGGPVQGLLRDGEAILAFNGTPSAGRSPQAARAFVFADTPYTLTVRRDGQNVTVPLRPVLSRTDEAFYRRASLAVVGFVWCLVASLIAFFRPGQPVARVAYAAGIAIGLFLFSSALNPIPPMRSMLAPLFARLAFPLTPIHTAIGLDFYVRFPRNAPPPRAFRWLRGVLYAVCGLLATVDLVDLGTFIGRDGYAAATHWFDVADPAIDWLWITTNFLTGVGVLAALIYNFRKVEHADDRRRLHWILWGTAVGVAPFVVISIADVVGQFLPALRPIVGPWVWRGNLVTVAIPLSFGYAIATNQLFDIRFVIRRGLQYLLARHALRALVLLPVAALAYGLVVHRDQPVGRLLVEHSTYVYWLVASAAALRFRAPLARRVDRLFFREAYDRERILVKLVEDLGQIDSGSHVSKLVSHEIETAFHPKCLFIWYREARRPALTLSYSSGGFIHTAELGPAAPLVQMAEREARIIEVSATATSTLPEADRAWLAETGVRLIVPLMSGDRHLVGLLMLGEKKSEEPYSSDDLALLQAVARQIGLARENARLKDRVDDDRRIRHEVLSKLEPNRVNLLKECPSCGVCYDTNIETCSTDGAELTLSLPVERTIDNKYRLERLLGRGGMGAVYEATDLRLARAVAVKILLGRAFGDRQALRRFEREAQASARLTHPNVVGVYDYGPVSGADGAFMAMELVRGRTLREELRQHGARPAGVAADWFRQIGAGVAAAHAHRIVHRDLKPENAIIASGTGAVKVLDFGLAKLQARDHNESASLTQSGAVMGTAGYMAPEQLTGGDVDERTDIFALGVMVAETVTGRRPFEGRTASELLLAILQSPLRFDHADPHWRELERVLQRAVAKLPDDRYQTVEDFAAQVLPVLQAFPSLGAGPDEPTRMA